MKHPETAALANEAFEAAKQLDPAIRSPKDFAQRIGAGTRTVFRWFNGTSPATGMALVVLREIVSGWLPKAGQ